MNTRQKACRRLKILRLLGLVSLLPAAASAQSQWLPFFPGGVYSWGDTANWSTGTVPSGAGTSVSFGAIHESQTITLDANRTLGSLAFSNNARAYMLSGSQLILDNNGLGSTVLSSGIATNLITSAISLADDGGNIFDIDDGRVVLTGVVSGSNELVKNGTGTLILSPSVANTYTGVTTINEGIILAFPQGNNINILGANAAGQHTVINAGGTFATSNDLDNNVTGTQSTGGWGTINEAFEINGNGHLGQGALRKMMGREQDTLGGAITMGSAARIQADYGTLHHTGTVAINHALTVSGSAGFVSLAGVASGSADIIHYGVSGFRLQANANTYTGTINSNLGEVRADTGDTTTGNNPYDTITALNLRNSALRLIYPNAAGTAPNIASSRFSTTAPISMRASLINIENASFNATVTNFFDYALEQTFGVTALESGGNKIYSRSSDAGSVTMIFTDLVRANPGTILELQIDTVQGGAAGNWGASAKHRIINSALEAGPTAVPFVGGWAHYGAEFLKYVPVASAGHGYRQLETSDQSVDTAENTWASGQNIRITSGNRTLPLGITTIQSLNIPSTTARTLSGAAGSTLVVESGGIITGGGVVHTISVPNLTAGNGDSYHLTLIASNSNTIRSSIVDNGGNPVSLVKAGGNTTSFLANNTYTGSTILVEGMFRDIIGARNITALGGGNLNMAGDADSQGTYETDRHFSRALGAGVGEVQLTGGGGFGGGSVGFSAYGAPVNVNFGGAGAEITWGSAHFNPGIFTLNGGNGTHVVTLVNDLDLGGEQRYIRLDGNASGGARQVLGTISGDVSNGGIVRRGGGVLFFDDAKSYTGGTVIQEGELWLRKGTGTAGANVSGNDIMIGAASRLLVDAPSSIGSRQMIVMQNQDDNSASAIAFGPGYGSGSQITFHSRVAANSATVPQTGAYDITLANQQTGNDRRNRVAVQLSGNHVFTRDVLGQIKTAAPDVEAWFGADTGNGTFTGTTLSSTGRTKTGGNQAFRLGSGGGTLTIANENVLSGAFPLIVGAEDQTARTNIGGVVYLPKAQNYSGTLTTTVGTAVTYGTHIGSGGVLVVGQNGALNTANNTILIRSAELRLGIDPAESFLGGVDTQYAARNIDVRSGTATLRTIPISGGSNGVLKLNNFTMRMDDADRSLSLNSIGTHYTATHFDGTAELQNGATARVANFVVGNDSSFQSGVGLLVFNNVISQTGAGLVHVQKTQGGVLALNADNTYLGETRVNQGRLVIGHEGAAGTPGSTILMNNANDRRADVEFRLDGAGPFTINNVISTTGGNDGSTKVITVGSYNGSSVNKEVRIASLVSNAGGAATTGNTASGLWFDGFGGYRTTITGATTLTRTLTDFRTRGALLTLEGVVGGAGALHKLEQGTLVLSNNNTYTGATNIYNGYVVAAHNNAFGNTTSAVTFNGTAFSQVLASGARTISRNFTNSATGSTQTIGGLDEGAKTFSGAFTLTRGINVTAVSDGDVTFSGVLSAAGGVNKVGTGLVILSNANTYTGGTTVSNGTLAGVAQAAGSPFGTNGAFTVSDGNLVLQGIAGATNTATTGVLTVNGGNATIAVNAPAGNTTFTFGSLTRSGNSTLVFKGGNTNIGSPSSEIVSFTAAPSFGPWAVIGGPGTGDNSAHYAGFSGGNVVTATYAGTGDIDGLTGPTDVWDAGAAASTLTGNRSGLAFRTAANVVLGGNTLSLGNAGQAGIILNNGADISGGTIAIGTNALSIYTDDAAVSTISSVIGNFRDNVNNTLGSGDPVAPSAAALIKFGPGTLELSGTNTFQGNVQVNQGTLSLTAPNVIPTFENLSAVTGSIVTIRPGATVALNGNNQEFGNLTGSVVVSPVLNTAGVLDLGSATLTVGRQGSNALFSGQITGIAGSKLLKIGGGRLTLDNWDPAMPNSLGTLEILQGVVQSRLNDNSWAQAIGFANSIPASTEILLRGGEFEAYVAGDNTSNFQFIPQGHSFTARDGNSIIDTNRWQGSAANKIIGFNNLTVDKNLLTITGGNTIYPRFDGTFTMTANVRLQMDAPGIINGPITGNYTLTKTGASNLEVNSSNDAWNGGAVLHDGVLLFGSRTPEVAERYMAGTNLFSYSATANLGTGDIVVNRGTLIRLNAPSNVLMDDGQRVLLLGDARNALPRVDIGLDAPLTDYSLRSTGNGALTIGLNDGFYTHAIDQSLLGNGRWQVGAWATTFYTASSMGSGVDNLFRFGGANGLFQITQGGALSGPSGLWVGADMLPNGFAIANGNGQVRISGDQSYTGNTLVFRNREGGSVQNFLEILGDSASPTFDVYGRLMARGAGRFTNDAGDQVNTVNLHPGSILRLDYVMDVNDTMLVSRLENSNLGLESTENKWGDSAPMLLNGATLNLVGSSGRVNREVIGVLSVKGGAAVLLERNTTNGQIILETPSITRVGQATFDVRENADELGRVDLQSQKFYIDNGASMLDAQNMMPVWMINPTRNMFLTYNNDLGVQNRAFSNEFTTGDATAAATFLGGLTSSSIARFAGGQGDPTLAGTVNVHALRIDAVADNETTFTGGQINIHSGGLIANNNNAAGRVNFNTTNVYFGDGSVAKEGVIYSAGNQITTRFGGVVTAADLTLNGPGQVQLTNVTNAISGNIQLNGGRLFLDGVGTAGTNTTLTLTGNYVQNNDGNQMPELLLRTLNANGAWTNGIIVAEHTPYVRVLGQSLDGTSLTSVRNQTLPGLMIEGTNTQQGTTFIFGTTSNTNNANNYNLIVSGATTLGGSAPIGFRIERGGTNIQGGGGFMTLAGAVTGTAPVIKSGDGYLVLQADNTGLSSPVTLNRGEIRGVGNNANNFFGTGDYQLNFGTLRMSTDAARTYFGATGQDLIIGGAVILVNDRNGGAAARTHTFGTNNGTNTIRTENGAHWRMTSDSSDSVVLEGKVIVNDSAMFYTDNAPTFLRDTFEGGGRFTKTGISQVLFDNNVANSDWKGVLDLQAGFVRVQQPTATLGGVGSSIIINPGAGLSVRSVSNLGTGFGITELRTTSRTTATVIGSMLPADFVSLKNHIHGLGTIGDGVGVLTLSGNQTFTTDPVMASFRDGNWYLGAMHDTGTLSANSVSPWGPGGNKFLLGGGSATLTLNPATAGAQFAGTNQMVIGIPHVVYGYATMVFGANSNNTYDGGTFVSRSRNLDGTYRGTVLSIQAGQVNATTYRTPLGSSLVDVFGEIRIENVNGTARNADTANANTWVFHKGTRLRFDNDNPLNTASTEGRWADNVAIALNTTVLEIYGDGATNAYNTETVGAISVEGGSEVVVRRRGAFLAEIIASGNLTRVGTGTLMLTGMDTNTNTVSGLGSNAATTAMRFKVANGNDLMSNNMVAPWITSRVDGQFLKYTADGFAPITLGGSPANYVSIVNAAATTLTAGGNVPLNDGTEIFSLEGTSNYTLASNLDLYALRLARDINVAANGTANNIFIRSGGLIQVANTPTINANLFFGPDALADGTDVGEALIWASNNIIQINGKIHASNVIKSGTSELYIRSAQPQFTGDWVVNGGRIRFLTPGAQGGGEIILNGSRMSDRDNVHTITEVLYGFNSGSPDLFDWNGGKITAYDYNRVFANTASDRLQQLPAMDLRTTNTVAGTGQPGLLLYQVDGNRTTVRTGTVTLYDHYQVHVESGSFGNGSTTGVQFGSGSGVGGLNNQGQFDLRKVGDGVLILGDNSLSFTGNRSITIGEGAVRVLHNGAFGGAGNTGNIEQGGALEIAVAGWSPSATLVQQPGSAERWAVNGARSGNVTLPSGVHLQIMHNQTGTQTVTLDGGSIMGYLPRDWDHVAVIHRLGSGVTINLASNSFLGQPYVASNNSLWDTARIYDIGKFNQTNANNPLDQGLRGSYLQIDGVITGPGGLTKLGQDMIVLNGANTYEGATIVENGILQIGRNNALPVGTDLSTETSSGMFDLNGYNQEVASLSGDHGSVNNGAFDLNTLTLNQSASTTYGGQINGNVSVVKSNTGSLTLTSASGMRGDLVINNGSVILGAAGSVNEARSIQIGAGSVFDVSAVTGGYSYDGRISGGGVGALRADNVSRAQILGSITVTDNVGTIARQGSISPGNSAGHLYVSGDLTLGGGLWGTSTKTERLTLELSAPTSTLAALGWDGSSVADWLENSSPDVLNGLAGDLSGHDYVNVGGELTLNEHGGIGVTLINGYQPQYGDVFNLLDWTSVSVGGFDAGPTPRSGGELGYDLNLPDLTAFQLTWHTDLFADYGVIFVVPEPGRMMLLFFGLTGLFLRRRR